MPNVAYLLLATGLAARFLPDRPYHAVIAVIAIVAGILNLLVIAA